MVMHARKTQRMNDGYFEKHQAHPYQNSKYGSSKAYGSTSDRYDRIRDSPNGNYRSDSPDSQSPRDRDRSYQPKNTYLQKIREKERENRDYKMSRDVKYTDCARSPKDKRIRESEHRTNNDRIDEKGILHPIKVSQNLASRDRKTLHNNSVDKRDERERVIRVGDWSEHVSSSGKKYYYNCKTEVSQWEKPREWIERERDRFRNRERDRERDTERCYSRSGHDKHSNLRPPAGMGGGKDLNRDSTGGRHWTGGGGGSSSSSRIDDNDISLKDISSRSLSRKQHQQQQQHYHDSESSQLIQQDMDISPGDSTPTSEVSFTTNSNQINNSCNIDHSNNNITQTSVTATSTTTVGPVLLANALPRLISHPVSSSSSSSTTPCSSTSTTQIQPPTTPGGRSDSSPQSTLSLLSGLQPITSSANIISNTPGPPLPPPIGNSGSCLNRISIDNVQQQRQTIIGDSAVHTSLSVDVNHTGTVVEGPPTPTHSETPDCSKVTVPVSSPPTTSGGGGGGNLSSLQGMSSSLQALRPQGPTITPSLANHYRDDLVNHVRGWPAEILEKQAQKLAEEAYYMSSIQCSKVSAELKSARSIVRLTEIQATLQEQRILFLRQQIKELEELKSQNSFMSDDS